MGIGSYFKIYLDILFKAIVLSVKNFHATLLIIFYCTVFYVGLLFAYQKHYFYAVIVLILFLFCLGSIFYIVGQIIKNGSFNIKNLFNSFIKLFFRAAKLIGIWVGIYLLISQFLITPISSFIKGTLLLYGIKIPLILFIFFVFNTFIEYIYLSEEPVDAVFISSIKFIEKNWLVWTIPTLVIMFLLNLYDYRLSIMPTLGFLSEKIIINMFTDPLFYAKSYILVVALIFRGLLFLSIVQKER